MRVQNCPGTKPSKTVSETFLPSKFSIFVLLPPKIVRVQNLPISNVSLQVLAVSDFRFWFNPFRSDSRHSVRFNPIQIWFNPFGPIQIWFNPFSLIQSNCFESGNFHVQIFGPVFAFLEQFLVKNTLVFHFLSSKNWLSDQLFCLFEALKAIN